LDYQGCDWNPRPAPLGAVNILDLAIHNCKVKLTSTFYKSQFFNIYPKGELSGMLIVFPVPLSVSSVRLEEKRGQNRNVSV
jgi:hypothetical protein